MHSKIRNRGDFYSPPYISVGAGIATGAVLGMIYPYVVADERIKAVITAHFPYYAVFCLAMLLLAIILFRRIRLHPADLEDRKLM